MSRAACFAGVLAVLLAGAIAPAAHADFTPFVLVSGSTSQEADYAEQPVVSANGLYVVYTGAQAGVRGIYEKNLQTGALATVVADPPGETDNVAGAPSVSSDGRYVSFTTTTDLATGTPGQCSSVYVADMSPPGGGAPTYTLASALNGSTTGLSYAGSATSGCPGGGSAAADRVAISGDGSEVAFTVVGQSNLCDALGASCGLPAMPVTTAAGSVTTSTPPDQVVVRNLVTDTTTLVSQTQSSLGLTPQPVPDGAAITDDSTGPVTAPPANNADPGDSTVSISADGSTVAWQGIEIPAQAPAAAVDEPMGDPQEYSEPLWRDIAAGPDAPTRRVIGGDDPVGPCPGGCPGPLDTQWNSPNADTGDIGPLKGSFVAYQGFAPVTPPTTNAGLDHLDAVTPQLSADGQTVAILSTQPATGEDPVYGSGDTPTNVSANAYVVNMAPGLSRSQALTRLTAWASDDFVGPLGATIDNIAISPEGNRVAFTTERTVFPYSPPALITPQLPQVSFDQLYVADLSDGTLQEVTSGYDGQPANGLVGAPSMSAGDGPMTFFSGATNLVYGALTDVPNGGQAFTTTQILPPATPGTETISAAPANPLITPDWVIGASVHHQADGSVELDVTVPGAGDLSAGARATVAAPGRTRRGRRGRRARRGRASAVPKAARRPRAATASVKRKRPRSRSTRRRGSGRSTVTRTVASAGAPSSGAGILQVRLAPGSRYRSLVDAKDGLYATIRVSFTSPGHPALTETLPVNFVKPKASKRRRR